MERGIVGVIAALAVGCGGEEGGRNGAGSIGIGSLGGESGIADSALGDDDSGGGGGGTGGTTSGSSLDEGDDGPKFDLAEPTFDVPSEECVGLQATIRDFSSSHPDFETFGGNGASVGLVMTALGADNTPQYNPGYSGAPMITSAATFADWYHDVAGTNMPFPIDLPLTDQGNGEFAFDSSAFFPLDGMGFGNEGNDHNFHFTTEVHTSFTYHGGEVFTFRGDDDVWMFVNGQLALDLGGLHPALEGSIAMDTLGLTVGVTYPMDIFHAERHTNESNFRIVTTIDCFQPPVG